VGEFTVTRLADWVNALLTRGDTCCATALRLVYPKNSFFPDCLISQSSAENVTLSAEKR
jgi:hypothetical protein